MQPLGTKKNYKTSWDKENQAISQDKKKPRNLLGQKNNATSWDKKIMQPHGTNKIMLSLGPIASKLVHVTPICSKWHQICPNRLDEVQMYPNWSKIFQKGLNGSKWDILVVIGPNGFKLVPK